MYAVCNVLFPQVFTINTPVTVNNYVTGKWTWSVPSSALDWIGVYDAAADVSVDDVLWYQYIHPEGSTSGTFTTANTTDGDAWMPTVSGSSYVMYYFRMDSYVNATRSEIFTAVDASPSVTLSVSLRTLYTGNAVSVSWVSSTPAQSGDWIGLFLPLMNPSQRTCYGGATL